MTRKKKIPAHLSRCKNTSTLKPLRNASALKSLQEYKHTQASIIQTPHYAQTKPKEIFLALEQRHSSITFNHHKKVKKHRVAKQAS